MWPWGHLAVGYLLYSVYTRYRYLDHPVGMPAVMLALGTQFPDIVDKPLAYWTPVLTAGRSLAHSVLIAAPVIVAVLWLGWRTGRGRSAIAFAIGYASHLPADAVGALGDHEPGELTFLLWPVLPAPEYESTGFEYHARKLVEAVSTAGADPVSVFAPWSDPFVAQLWLFVAALGLWVLHGGPPLASLRALARRRGKTTPDGAK